MTEPIKLPPLVGTLAAMPPHHQKVIEAYGKACARAAIEAALQSHDREDALIEVMLEACDEWDQYVEIDTAPRTLREHVQLAIDHARRIEGDEE